MPHWCPRRDETAAYDPNSPLRGFNEPTPDEYGEHHRCSYCGSIEGGEFLRLVAAGAVEVGPTDKNYKAYVHYTDGESRDRAPIKLYFQHLDEAQKDQFIELYNGKQMKLGYPGRFYVTPFFCTRKD